MPDELLTQADNYTEQLAIAHDAEKEEFFQYFCTKNPSFVEMFLKITEQNKALLESTVKEVYTLTQE